MKSKQARTPFQVIPAIDLLDGQVVRLFQGRYEDSTVYGADPAAQARAFSAAGAELLHVVDLNAARNGDRSANQSAVASILAAAAEMRASGRSFAVEIGGGIRDREAAEEYLTRRGVDRIILGTAAVRRPELVGELTREFSAQRIIVGVDALEGSVRVSGWEENAGLPVLEFLRDLEDRGAREVIYTDIARDGVLGGPDLDGLRQILQNTELRVIASGGVGGPGDVQKLLELRGEGDYGARLVGAISGKAIYEGRLDLSTAVQLCRQA